MKPRHKWDVKEIGGEGMDWINLAQHWVWWQIILNMVINLQVPREELDEMNVSASQEEQPQGVKF